MNAPNTGKKVTLALTDPDSSELVQTGAVSQVTVTGPVSPKGLIFVP